MRDGYSQRRLFRAIRATTKKTCRDAAFLGYACAHLASGQPTTPHCKRSDRC